MVDYNDFGGAEDLEQVLEHLGIGGDPELNAKLKSPNGGVNNFIINIGVFTTL